MGKLTEDSYLKILNLGVNHRFLTYSDIRKNLFAWLIFSGLMTGVAFAIVNAGNIGWNALSIFWKRIFIVEFALLIIHFIVIFCCLPSNPFSWKLSSIFLTIFIYKAAFDPFLPFMMFAKDYNLYDKYLATVSYIIIICIIFHLIFLSIWIRKKKDDKKVKIKNYNKQTGASFVGFAVVLTSIMTRHMQENLFLPLFLVAITIVCAGILLGVCKFVLITLRIFNLFSVQASPTVKAK